MAWDVLGRLLARLREWYAVEESEERIEGSGDVYLDPAYNGRYEAERELKRLSNADEEDERSAKRALAGRVGRLLRAGDRDESSPTAPG
ncbi:hypothetical protein G9464_04945 [Halostella sp. JP-L12]|uniref:hypothetical protein n=1 Tax=Halostella TaxID=1843185 RepID=UPI000EF81188|nr:MULTISPECIES: hypothetical protein [Halostella]NHN46943.1 hypothetical protein [Halostella sp. JP-L12]